MALSAQVGAPADRSQYIHRLGRTARAGKRGEGLLLLCDFEAYALKELTELPVTRVPPPAVAPATLAAVAGALARVPEETKGQCYQAWLGYYNGSLRKLGWDKHTLVRWANQLAGLIGCHELPVLQKKTVGKMGLKGVPGLRVE